MAPQVLEQFELPTDSVSDYGSDLDTDGEERLARLMRDLEATAVSSPRRLGSAGAGAFPPTQAASTLSVPPKVQNAIASELLREHTFAPMDVHGEVHRVAVSPFLRRVISDRSTLDVSDSQQPEQKADQDRGPVRQDNRSPLERFRTAPMKPLSVTDLVSPAWCELQYWFTLTKHGKKRPTTAMRQGSDVHKVLEDQVHQAVPVDVYTREDAWALKLWNVIQGLRTLRVVGMTRELQVWGIVDGQLVNGVIDELSYVRPEQHSESEVTQSDPVGEAGSQVTQQTIKEFFSTKENTTSENEEATNEPNDLQEPRKVYVTDVKTRGTRTMPSNAAMRLTSLQLMLYRKLLADLAANLVSADKVFKRYNLRPSEKFTEAFVGQIAELDFNFRETSDAEDYAPFGGKEECFDELAQHNCLNQLWGLMVKEFTKTIPTPDVLGDMLRVEYRSRTDGTVIGSKTFANDSQALQDYLQDEMSWWKGHRDARGVDIEDAFKCRICEFADECSWRIARVDEATQRHRARSALPSETST